MFLQRIDNHCFTDIFFFIICEIMWNDLRLPFLQFLIHSNQYPRLTVISGSKGWSTEVSSSEMGGEERRCIDAFSNVNSAKENAKDKGRILSLLADNKHRADNRYTNCTSHHDVGLWISFFYLSYAYHILWRNLETCPIFHLKIFIIRYLRKK